MSFLRPYRMIIIAGLIAALGVGLAFAAIQQLREASVLQRDGVQAIATVSEKWIVPDEDRDNSHRVRYAFSLPDGIHSFERSVPVTLYRVVESGSTFQVTVSPNNPDLHEIFPGQLSGRAQSRLFGGVLVTVFGVILFLFQGGADLFRRNSTDV